MRISRRFVFCLLLFLIGTEFAAARVMKLTIYDDGISCPGGCDAHVVMNKADNGTANAHRAGTRGHPVACVTGASCEICFSDSTASCMAATYRGGGPPAGAFDFTPAFYDTHCGQAGLPAALNAQCAALDRAVARRGFDQRVNCFAQPTSPKCADAIAAAKTAQEGDVPKRSACIKEGERVYNRRQTDPAERRTNACNYTLLLLGGSASKPWHKLLPAACRPGTYVDQFGLDCCSASVRFAAANGDECIKFFPR